MIKDYIVLLIGLVISISIFYMFQTLALNKEFTMNNSIIGSIVFVFQIGSVLVAFITFFYIFLCKLFSTFTPAERAWYVPCIRGEKE